MKKNYLMRGSISTKNQNKRAHETPVQYDISALGRALVYHKERRSKKVFPILQHTNEQRISGIIWAGKTCLIKYKKFLR